MKTISAAILAFALLAGAAEARVSQGVFADLDRTAPRSVFDDLATSAPRSVFDDLRNTAPRSPFDQIRDSAPRAANDGNSIPLDLASE